MSALGPTSVVPAPEQAIWATALSRCGIIRSDRANQPGNHQRVQLKLSATRLLATKPLSILLGSAGTKKCKVIPRARTQKNRRRQRAMILSAGCCRLFPGDSRWVIEWSGGR